MSIVRHESSPGHVAVVGASLAGLFTARELARRGVEVTVYERSPRLEPLRRTLIVTAAMRDLLGRVGEGAVLNEVHQFDLHAGAVSLTVPLARPDLIVERAELIRYLAKEAEAAGVRIDLASRFVAMTPSRGGWELRFERGPDRDPVMIRSGQVVGADGAGSRVARSGGWLPRLTAPLVQAIVRLPEGFDPKTSPVWFRPADTPYFYWLVAESETSGALGLIGEDGREPRRRLDRFLAGLGLEAKEYQAARIPIYRGWAPVRRRLGDSVAYVVGDAAGHVKVSTVGGVVTGLRGARGVAEAIATGRRSPELARLRRELDLHLWVRRAIHGFSVDDHERLLRLLAAAGGAEAGRHSRDRAALVLARVLAHQPRIAAMAFRGFLSPSFSPSSRPTVSSTAPKGPEPRTRVLGWRYPFDG